ncbi:MAG: AbrB/MazE/SpoVT family DNA-binding domain-containing protein [Alphaproteobacteria bacterium]|nr:AbrB/MazE/SpoVT family DNA-binding domain-containing protein [Alphaproteobacteria bacterium]
MNVTLKLTAIGNSTGTVFPKEVLARLKVERGDQLYLTETPEGYLLTPYEEGFASQMDAAQNVMRRYRNTLRELSK